MIDVNERYDADAELERLLNGDDGESVVPPPPVMSPPPQPQPQPQPQQVAPQPQQATQGFNSLNVKKFKKGVVGCAICAVITAIYIILPLLYGNVVPAIVRAIIFYKFFHKYNRARLFGRWSSVKTILIFILFFVIDIVAEVVLELIYAYVIVPVLGAAETISDTADKINSINPFK